MPDCAAQETVSRMRSTITLPATMLVLASALAACGGGKHVDKSGAPIAARPVQLTLQAPDGDDADATYFATQVKTRTGGRVRISIDGDSYTSADPDNELRLVRDLRAGTVALGYVPSRAWERDGITSFRALQAPLLIRDYATLAKVTRGPIGAGMLRALAGDGLVGLALVPKELRRPLGRRALTSLESFRGARIRVVTSPAGELALRSLGARPLTTFDAHQAGAALRSGSLDGLETEVHSISTNAYTTAARMLPANLPLFAKAQTLVIGKAALDRLTAADRQALRAAAAATVAHADPAAQERAELGDLCRQGLRVVTAAPADVAALEDAARTSYAKLGRDLATRRAIAAIEALGASAPVSPLPQCPEAQQQTTASVRFPEGRFASRITAADFEAGGAGDQGNFPTPFVVTMRDGRWKTNENPAFGGHYTVRGDELTFAVEQPADAAGHSDTLRWSYYRRQLTLKVVDVADAGSRVIWTAHPWRRVGS
jgi:TRAP-type C4-dicarboxylate transport system substrate-binding protein